MHGVRLVGVGVISAQAVSVALATAAAPNVAAMVASKTT